MHDIERLINFGPLVLEHKIQEIITQQATNGWLFDVEKANALIKHIEEEQARLSDKITPLLPKTLEVKYKNPINRPFLKSGKLNQNVHKWFESSTAPEGVLYVDLVGGPFTRVNHRDPNLNSVAEVKNHLFSLGWEPTEWNYKKDKGGRKIKENGEFIKTSPKLTEDSYESLQGTLGRDVAKYLVYKHRLGLVNGLKDKVRSDGRLSGAANTQGTPTYRFKHRVIVNIPKNDEKVLLGREMRDLFIAEPGRVIVGHDAAGLEAHMEAHETYSIDLDYALELVNGDQHMKNAERWGLVDVFGPKAGRNIAKGGKYALTYGAYPSRLAATLKISKKEAQHIFDQFWSDDNPLYVLQRRLAWQFKRFGWIRGLDGRVIVPRKEGDLLNYRFQSDGAIVMKRSIVLLEQYRENFGIDARKVGDFHDEGQNSVREDQAYLFGNLAVRSIVKAGEYYKLNVPLGADFKVGQSWAETH